MQTSKITSTGLGKGKGKGRSTKWYLFLTQIDVRHRHTSTLSWCFQLGHPWLLGFFNIYNYLRRTSAGNTSRYHALHLRILFQRSHHLSAALQRFPFFASSTGTVTALLIHHGHNNNNNDILVGPKFDIRWNTTVSFRLTVRVIWSVKAFYLS